MYEVIIKREDEEYVARDSNGDWRAWEETSKLWNSNRTRALDELRSLIYHEIEEGYQPYAVQYRLRYGSQTFEPKWAVIQEHQYEEQ